METFLAKISKTVYEKSTQPLSEPFNLAFLTSLE